MIPLTVLVVDDSPDDRFILSRSFAKTGLSVQLFEAENGAEGINYLSHAGRFSDPHAFPSPDLLLLDLRMPGQSGFDVLHWLQQHPEQRPKRIVVLSGSEFDREIREAQQLGAATCLVKPASPEQLRRLLSEELGLAA